MTSSSTMTSAMGKASPNAAVPAVASGRPMSHVRQLRRGTYSAGWSVGPAGWSLAPFGGDCVGAWLLASLREVGGMAPEVWPIGWEPYRQTGSFPTAADAAPNKKGRGLSARGPWQSYRPAFTPPAIAPTTRRDRK